MKREREREREWERERKDIPIFGLIVPHRVTSRFVG